MTGSLFADGVSKGEAADVARLLKVALPLMQADGRIPWAKVTAALPADFPIGYSRGWLIIREAWIRANKPEWFAPMAKLTEAAAKRYGQKYDETQHVLRPLVVRMRGYRLVDGQWKLDPKVPQYSWGEIMVRLSRTEGQVRRAFKAQAGLKDLGQRIGKGGRFAYDDPTLYDDAVRAIQGAHIPADLKGKPEKHQLVNYVPPTTGEEASA